MEPSSGAMGRTLKMANARLIIRLHWTMIIKNHIMECWSAAIPVMGISLSKRPLISAKSTFDRGPAALIQSMLFLGFLKLYGFTGTGLAHPKCTIKIMSVPNGSKCARGFMVKRPLRLAVSSPYLFATKACENSWNVNANKIGGANNSNCWKSIYFSQYKVIRFRVSGVFDFGF